MISLKYYFLVTTKFGGTPHKYPPMATGLGKLRTINLN